MPVSDRGVDVGFWRDDGVVTEVQEPILLGGYAAKQCPVRVQNDFLPLVQTLKWVPSPEDQARLDAGIAFEQSVFDDLVVIHPTAVVVDPQLSKADAIAMTVEAMNADAPLILAAEFRSARAEPLRPRRQHRKPPIRKQFQQLPIRIPNQCRALRHRRVNHYSPELRNLLQNAPEIRHRKRDMRQPHLIHDALRPDVNFTLRVIHQFEHKAVPDQIGRMHSERFGKLYKLGGKVVRRVEFPPELKSEQAFVETA